VTALRRIRRVIKKKRRKAQSLLNYIEEVKKLVEEFKTARRGEKAYLWND